MRRGGPLRYDLPCRHPTWPGVAVGLLVLHIYISYHGIQKAHSHVVCLVLVEEYARACEAVELRGSPPQCQAVDITRGACRIGTASAADSFAIVGLAATRAVVEGCEEILCMESLRVGHE